MKAHLLQRFTLQQMRVLAVPKSIAISPEIQFIMLDNDFLFIDKYFCKISTSNLMIIN